MIKKVLKKTKKAKLRKVFTIIIISWRLFHIEKNTTFDICVKYFTVYLSQMFNQSYSNMFYYV